MQLGKSKDQVGWMDCGFVVIPNPSQRSPRGKNCSIITVGTPITFTTPPNTDHDEISLVEPGRCIVCNPHATSPKDVSDIPLPNEPTVERDDTTATAIVVCKSGKAGGDK